MHDIDAGRIIDTVLELSHCKVVAANFAGRPTRHTAPGSRYFNIALDDEQVDRVAQYGVKIDMHEIYGPTIMVWLPEDYPKIWWGDYPPEFVDVEIYMYYWYVQGWDMSGVKLFLKDINESEDQS